MAKTEPLTQPAAQQTGGLARVWDPLVRLLHWAIVLSFVVAWLTHEGEGMGWIHRWAGYAAAALVLARIVWGVAGTQYARFSQFVHDPVTVTSYLKDIAAGREARYIGHNPAGGAMVVVLLLGLLATSATGWMMMLHVYHHVHWVRELHSLSSHGLFLLIILHLAGVALASRRHGENLVISMLTGKKRAPGPRDIN